MPHSRQQHGFKGRNRGGGGGRRGGGHGGHGGGGHGGGGHGGGHGGGGRGGGGHGGHRGGGRQHYRQHTGGPGRAECPMCGAIVGNLAQHVREQHDEGGSEE